MYNEKVINDIFSELKVRGSNEVYLEELKKKSIDEIKKDYDLRDTLSSIANNIETSTEMFLDSKNEYGTNYITGISTGIYLPDYSSNGTYKYTLVSGKTSRYHEGYIDFETKFDVASITKLYSLILTLKLEEEGLLDLNAKVSDLNPDFQKLGDFTLNDLIRLFGELKTEKTIKDAPTKEEAISRFKSTYLASSDRTKNTYNDLGPMIIADTIEKVVSNKLGKSVSYDKIMNDYLFEPLNIKNSMFNPGTINISGNANDLGLPHDEKSRILGGVTGHAGMFTDSESLYHLADGIFNKKFLNVEHVNRLGSRVIEYSNRGNLGVYLKTNDLSKETYTPSLLSDGSFSHQGWTGSVVVFDPSNMIHNNILVNAIDLDTNESHLYHNKPKGFLETFRDYQGKITEEIMIMYAIKQYYNRYCNVKEDIFVKRLIM